MRIIVLLVQKEVLGLDISVANTIRVQVVESVEGLAHDEGCLSLGQMLPLGDEKEQFTSLAKLCHKEADALGFPSLVELDDVGMIEAHEDVDFVFEGLIVLNLALLHGFDSYFDTCLLVKGEVDGAVATRAKLLFEEVLILDVTTA